MTIKLTARRARQSSPAWLCYEGDMQVPFVIVSLDKRGNWTLSPVSVYGPAPAWEREEWNHAAQVLCPTSPLSEALACVRQFREYQVDQWKKEAEFERETERRVEEFYENRMSDEDKAREDEEYAMYEMATYIDRPVRY